MGVGFGDLAHTELCRLTALEIDSIRGLERSRHITKSKEAFRTTFACHPETSAC